MMWFEKFIHTGFALSLFVNAWFFVPQIVKLLKTKRSEELSLLMFVGFNVVQLFTVLHAYFMKDNILMGGFLFSLLTCGTVTALIVIYRLYPGKLKKRQRMGGAH